MSVDIAVPPWPRRLVEWFSHTQRDLPWRKQNNPYYTWVSEMMLQQTQVDTVVPYFNRFIKQFPTIDTLAEADLQDVLKCWEGLGYYSRARNFHKAARIVKETFHSTLPSDYETLQTLPGIGPYIAAAITSIAFHQPVPVVDGNVLRVFTRFWAIGDDIRKEQSRKKLFDALLPVIQTVDPNAFNQGIMELGAMVCKPTRPNCGQCPIHTDCSAYLNDKIADFPFKSKKPPVPHLTIVVGVVWHKHKILIAKRNEDQMLGGLWEFPGGKQENGESNEDTLHRELREECGITVTICEKYTSVKHTYSHFKITLHAYKCELNEGTATAEAAEDIRWISLDDIDLFPFPKANRKVIDCIKQSETIEEQTILKPQHQESLFTSFSN